uniref:DUF445 domain-containing protein n=1 Tax=Aplanochytrium stocchinoi TaxID=215587 RepID=A0A7S3LRC1_9STRA|mmetsp:Transcript_8463/g.10693  ORF Transcript_8463/g.10693 Transcript_8463/m.10693 type:complete len:477 (-) Transcript_8463:415-1845(-)|eukprot:CAMPEP_0204873056 /NCGR_PEP_ID=MMETSP1348-20121228/39591_1 /ASSEMBLY_ACC=CAM_ASM_000700 /TAXON_ID=215587 /ORGANISM="Aplanochytrium stocchinoi, Strain GSBS06" /LENGTH=476 /DNA_ID=CAMNT_0052028193 /DNA_START=295 /DNA_END=1725 /DNA_ORIENTATION=-
MISFQTTVPLLLGVLASYLVQCAMAWSIGEEEETWQRDMVFGRKLEERSAGDKFAYASIPFVSGFVGFITNWLALKMTFYPIYFFGVELLGKYSRVKDQPVGCIGWQGIVPTKAAKMASMSVKLMTEKLFNIKEIFSRIKVDKAAEKMKAGFEKSVGGIIDTVSDKYVISQKTEWKRTEAAIKQQMIDWTLAEAPTFTEGFMSDLIENLDDVFDLEDMCVQEMVANRQLLNDVFEKVGAKELIFIRNSGFYFGFLFGLVQLALWFFFPYGLILPVFGFVVGYLTNFIALKMIFNPINAYHINLGFTTIKIQGLFLKRQKEASLMFARQIVGTVLHSKNMWGHMLNGPNKSEFLALLDKHVDQMTDALVGQFRPLVMAYLGEDNFDEMKLLVRESARDQIEAIIDHLHEYTDDALDLENEIDTKMAALPSKDFERVLHPVFEEDEFKLIIVGAFLGVIVGLFQQFVVFRVDWLGGDL